MASKAVTAGRKPQDSDMNATTRNMQILGWEIVLNRRRRGVSSGLMGAGVAVKEPTLPLHCAGNAVSDFAAAADSVWCD